MIRQLGPSPNTLNHGCNGMWRAGENVQGDVTPTNHTAWRRLLTMRPTTGPRSSRQETAHQHRSRTSARQQRTADGLTVRERTPYTQRHRDTHTRTDGQRTGDQGGQATARGAGSSASRCTGERTGCASVQVDVEDTTVAAMCTRACVCHQELHR